MNKAQRWDARLTFGVSKCGFVETRSRIRIRTRSKIETRMTFVFVRFSVLYSVCRYVLSKTGKVEKRRRRRRREGITK